MEYQTLKYSIRDSIAILTINRPNALNALNALFFEEMNRLIQECGTNPQIKVIIITGEGKTFAAGADISEMAKMTPEQARQFSIAGQKTFQRLELLDIPVIAAVNGFALGGGCELAMACDIRYAGPKAKFGQPEANLGLIPGFGGTQRLSRLVGLGNALHLLYTGDMIDAEHALHIGLIQKIIPQETLIDETLQLALKIASKGPKAIKHIKRITRQGIDDSLENGCSLEAQHFGDTFGNEGTEGMNAFLEKRSPRW